MLAQLLLAAGDDRIAHRSRRIGPETKLSREKQTLAGLAYVITTGAPGRFFRPPKKSRQA